MVNFAEEDIELTPVESSNVDSIGYSRKRYRLYVKFKNNPNIYRFEGVSKNTHTNFMKSESKGKYFYKHIKGKYTSTKIDQKDL